MLLLVLLVVLLVTQCGAVRHEKFEVRPGVDGSVSMGDDAEGDAWMAKFEWQGVSGGTGEKWEISVNGKNKRGGVLCSLLLFLLLCHLFVPLFTV